MWSLVFAKQTALTGPFRGRRPPRGYGDGFRAAGVEPPPWRRSTAQVEDVSSCGVADLLRNGMVSLEAGSARKYALEPIMAEHGVDVYLCGHEHNYERLWPVMNGTFTKTYDQPGKPVHVVTGSGGAYGKDPFGDAGPWDAFRSSEWSWSDVSVNRTHFALTQRLANDSTVVDAFVLRR